MTDYMTCQPSDLPETAKQKAVDWARTNKHYGTTDWSFGDVDNGYGLAHVARYIATQDTAAQPSTESHEDAAKRIADKYWSKKTPLWSEARDTILTALRDGDLVLPPQPVDPDLVNARILASKVSDTGMDYTDGKHDCFVNVQVFYKAHQRGLIKMGDGV